ncbi:hypothetical protein JCM15415_15590 [Methanobacterium movens]
MKSKKITITVFLAIFLFLSMGSVYAEDTDEQFTIASENAVTDFSQADILNAATNVKTYTETNNKIPETVYINNNAVKMPQLLYLMTSSVNNVNQGSSASVNYKNVNPAPNPSENTRGGTLTKTAYLDASQRIKTFMDNNNHAPNFATTTQGTISFETQIYLFSRILSFYQSNNQLPGFATIIPGLKVEAGSSTPANNPPVVPPVTPEPEDPPVTPEPEDPPVINPPTPDPVTSNFTLAQINAAATNVKKYYDTNKKLPSTVTINNQQITLNQFLYLLTTATINLNTGKTTPITPKNINTAPNPSENARQGTITKTAYLDLAQRIKTFMDNNNHAPNFATTTLGTTRYETQIYAFSRILDFYQTNKYLPNTVTIIPGIKINTGVTPPVVPPVTPEPEDPPVTPEPEDPPVINPPTPDPVTSNFTLAQINAAATNVKKYYDTNKKLPSTVTINNQQITLNQFLYLLTTATINLNTGKTTPITPKNINTAPNPSENARQGTITKTAYLDLAQRIKTFMDNNNHAPNFATTTLGTTRYETQIYAFSRILDFYQTNKYLPNTVTIIPGIKINTGVTPPVVPPVTPEPEDPPVTPEPEDPPVINPPTPDPVTSNFTLAQINAAATNVKKYYDTNKKLPSTVTINNQQITLNQFLYLLTTATINLNTGKTTPITPKNINTAPNPSENARQGTITKTAYLDLAQRIKTFMDNNNHAPNFATTTLGTTRYETQIYAFSRILDFYQTNKYLPNTVTIIPGIKINTGSSPPSQVTTTLIAQTSYGFVQKIESYGTGSNKVAIIIGVHPHELAVHVAMEDAIKAAQLNNIKLDIFQVVVYDGREMDESRNQGEYLASQYIVPLIDSSYQLVMDVHGNRGTYALTDFIFAPSQGALSTSFANQLVTKSNGLIGYLYIEGSSPPKITIPIAQKGIPAVVLEFDWRFEQSVLLQKCKTIVAALDAIFA